MDYSGGTASKPWYPTSATPTANDRGSRTPDVAEEYDSWTSPAPDGKGRWTWGDSAYQTGVWIDLPNKHGFLIIPTVHTGRTWYQNSTLNYAGKTAEFQVFDPMQLAETISGSRAVWNVKPQNIWRPAQFSNQGGGTGNGPTNTACAASFDSQTNRLYVRWTFYEGNWPYCKDRIHVWQVG
jgi:hypothetical protein